jgi:acyl carrier protein
MPETPSPEEIRQIVAGHLPRGAAARVLTDDLPLGDDGAGLDSIAIVELLIDCEDRFGVRISEDFLAGPVSVGSLIDAVIAHARHRPS